MGKLVAMTALGAHVPVQMIVGPVTITERFDVALASVAVRKGRELLGDVPLPGPAMWQAGEPYSAFWVAPGMWFVEADFAAHEGIAEEMKAIFGDAASVTEQTDAWVVFDVAAPDLAPMLERLCNVDFRAVPLGHATRTVVEHLGCYLVRHAADKVRLYAPRSSAQSLLHALEVAAKAAF